MSPLVVNFFLMGSRPGPPGAETGKLPYADHRGCEAGVFNPSRFFDIGALRFMEYISAGIRIRGLRECGIFGRGLGDEPGKGVKYGNRRPRGRYEISTTGLGEIRGLYRKVTSNGASD